MSDFPQFASFTITNRCNLRCKMCGQWGVEGYLKDAAPAPELPVEPWLRVADEMAEHGLSFVGIRGGEPFLYPGMLELLSHLKQKGLGVSIDSNGMLLEKHAADIVDLGIDNINLSIDGPEPIHDEVRGVAGGFQRIARGVAAIREREKKPAKESVLRCIVFTIGPDSYKGLADMPDVARQLGIASICIVPYYYFDAKTCEAYEKVMREELDCEGYSTRGFHREDPGVDPDEFLSLLRAFKENLGDLELIPYMAYSEEQYREWFASCGPPVDNRPCRMPERLIDIQPTGDVNFCVDFPDYVIGNITEQSIQEIWNSDRAQRFRDLLRKQFLPSCGRCGARYMAGAE